VSKWAPYFLACLLLVATSVSPEWGEPVNLGPNVNWAGFDYYPSISSDETKLYFASSNRPGGYGDDDIWISTWQGAEWGVAVNAGPNVNSEWRDLSPSISSDGTMLYFVSWGRAGGYGAYDIWFSTWEDTMWGSAVNAGPNVNTAYSEWSVNISFDQDRLHFASNRPGSLDDYDIWVSEWDSANSEWGPAENVGRGVNTDDREYSPCLSSTGTELYFARWGGGLGYVDIWVSQWEDTVWGNAVNLGAPVNTPTWDNGPSISSDGTKLYFASGRESSHPAVQDIWVSEWVPGVQEEERPRARKEVFLTCLPNPFSSTTIIRYSVSEPGQVSLHIYDAAGRLVRAFADGIKEPGTQEVSWDGRDDRGEPLTGGIYFCRLQAGGHSATSKLHLVR